MTRRLSEIVPPLSIGGNVDNPAARGEGVSSYYTNYLAALATAGGVVSSESLSAIQTFVTAGVSGGWLNSSTKFLWFMAGSNLAARLVPLVGNGNVIREGTWAIDSEMGGMKPASNTPDNNAQFGVGLPGAAAITLACDVLEHGTVNESFNSGNLMGALAAGQPGYGTYLVYNNYLGDVTPDGAASLYLSIYGEDNLWTATPLGGLLAGTKSSTNGKRLYQNGSLVASGPVEAGDPGVAIGTFRGWRSGEQLIWSNDRIGFFYISEAELTSAEMLSLSNALSVFNQAIGRRNNLVLSLAFDGANNSTVFPETSQYQHTITRHGSPIISTAQSASGGASGYFDGSSVLSSTAQADWAFGRANFEITCDVRIDSPLDASGAAIVGYWNSAATSTNSWLLHIDQSTRRLRFSWWNGSQQTITSTATLDFGVWASIKVKRVSGVLSFYKDGSLVDSSPLSANLGYVNTPLTIGGIWNNGSPVSGIEMTGHLDNLVIRSDKLVTIFEDLFGGSGSINGRSLETGTGSWTIRAGSLTIAGGAISNSTPAGRSYATVNSGSTSYTATVTLTNSTAFYAGVIFRYQDVNNWRGVFVYNGTTLAIVSMDAGVEDSMEVTAPSTVATISVEVNANSFYVRCNGSNVSLFTGGNGLASNTHVGVLLGASGMPTIESFKVVT